MGSCAHDKVKFKCHLGHSIYHIDRLDKTLTKTAKNRHHSQSLQYLKCSYLLCFTTVFIGRLSVGHKNDTWAKLPSIYLYHSSCKGDKDIEGHLLTTRCHNRGMCRGLQG